MPMRQDGAGRRRSCAAVSGDRDQRNIIASRRAEVDGVSLHYEESGSGGSLVLVHGFGQSSFCWRPLHGSDEGHRLIALDMKGFGASDKPADGRYSVNDQARLVVGFTRALGLTNFLLVGHSFGGAVCLRTAQLLRAEGDGRLRGLVLVGSAAYPQQMPDFMRLFRTPLLAELVLWMLPPRLGAWLALRRAYADPRSIERAAVRAYARALASPGGRQALLATARQILPDNLDEIIAGYREIDVPTLLVWGECDTIVPPAVGRRLAHELPHARLEIIPRRGHVPQEECPAAFVRLLSYRLPKQTRLPSS